MKKICTFQVILRSLFFVGLVISRPGSVLAQEEAPKKAHYDPVLHDLLKEIWGPLEI